MQNQDYRRGGGMKSGDADYAKLLKAQAMLVEAKRGSVSAISKMVFMMVISYAIVVGIIYYLFDSQEVTKWVAVLLLFAMMLIANDMRKDSANINLVDRVLQVTDRSKMNDAKADVYRQQQQLELMRGHRQEIQAMIAASRGNKGNGGEVTVEQPDQWLLEDQGGQQHEIRMEQEHWQLQ